MMVIKISTAQKTQMEFFRIGLLLIQGVLMFEGMWAIGAGFMLINLGLPFFFEVLDDES